MFLFILMSIVSIHWTVAGSTSSGGNCTFRGAVYEHAYHPSMAGPIENMLVNLQIYDEQVKAAAAQGAQIIVFPEVGITGLDWDSSQEVYYQVVADPGTTSEIPCLMDEVTNETLVPYRLSCMARANEIMVVANFPTRVPCNNATDASCPSRGQYHFNTDVAFDTNGTVLATYHKVNLYNEPQYDMPPTIEYVYFDTDFGRFGIVTCFDLIWKEPTVTLVEKYHVDTILFPTAWMDQLPYLASVQAQAAWAAGLGVNLLAANMHFPVHGFMGSGLYDGTNGPVLYSYTTNDTEGQLLVANLSCHSESGPSTRVPDSIRRRQVEPRASTIHFIKYQNLSEFIGAPLLEAAGNIQLCQGTLCCRATYELDASPQLTGQYMLVIHQGNVSEDDIYTIAVEICSVLWCHDEQLSSCTVQPTDTNTSLVHLSLSGNFSTPHLYPSVLLDNLQLQSADQWRFQITADGCEQDVWCPSIEMEVATMATSISIYGRRYDLDVTVFPKP